VELDEAKLANGKVYKREISRKLQPIEKDNGPGGGSTLTLNRYSLNNIV